MAPSEDRGQSSSHKHLLPHRTVAQGTVGLVTTSIRSRSASSPSERWVALRRAPRLLGRSRALRDYQGRPSKCLIASAAAQAQAAMTAAKAAAAVDPAAPIAPLIPLDATQQAAAYAKELIEQQARTAAASLLRF